MTAAKQQGATVLATVPGAAFDELKGSHFSEMYPDIWKRMVVRHKTTFSKQFGVQIHLDIEPFEWLMFRAALAGAIIKITRIPYDDRTKNEQKHLICLNQAIAAIDRVLQ